MMRAPHEHPADPLLVARIFAAALGRPVHFPVPATIVASNAAGVSVAGSKEENSKPAPAARKFLEEVAHD